MIGITICILLVITIIPLSINAEDVSGNPLPTKSKFRIFIFCDIEILTTGRAFLFPGYLDSNDNGINVTGSSGFCFVGNRSISGAINIKGIDINNWEWMFIAIYNGFIKNYELNLPPKPQPIFSLDGNAIMVLVAYKS